MLWTTANNEDKIKRTRKRKEPKNVCEANMQNPTTCPLPRSLSFSHSLSLSLSDAEPLCRNAMTPQRNENTHAHTRQQGSSSSSSSSSRAAARASEVYFWRSVEHLCKSTRKLQHVNPSPEGEGASESYRRGGKKLLQQLSGPAGPARKR
jgi:hypothetical protein